jgi:hypothetical protein
VFVKVDAMYFTYPLRFFERTYVTGNITICSFTFNTHTTTYTTTMVCDDTALPSSIDVCHLEVFCLKWKKMEELNFYVTGGLRPPSGHSPRAWGREGRGEWGGGGYGGTKSPQWALTR